MSASFTIYNGAKIEIETGAATAHSAHCGWIELTVTETDGASHEITIHFDSPEAFAAAKKLDHIFKAMNVIAEAA